ncbi:MAG: M28 family peptidase [Candidatus Brocadiae bacterium]|nr:M28 family peptidase [Candidatus Brocadiia bacterium]
MLIAQEKHLKILEEVISLPTAPFQEQKVVEYIHTFAKNHGLAVTQDPYGNQCLEYKHEPAAKALGFLAHMDHPGFVIEGIEQSYLKLRGLGGIVIPEKGDKLRLFADGKETLVTVVEVRQEQLQNSKATYLLTEGYLPEKIEGFAMYTLDPYRLEGNIVHSRAIDDLAGCAALLALMCILSEQKPKAHIYLFFSRAEETGFIGTCAMALNHTLPADVPIITLEASKEIPNAIQGSGVVVRLGDKSGMFDGETTSFLLNTASSLAAQETQFRYQKAILDGGTCESSVLYAFGYQTTGMAVPLGNYHNNGSSGKAECEYIHKEDWLNMVNLLWETVMQNEKRTSWKETKKEGFALRYQEHSHRLASLPISDKSKAKSC